MLHVDINKAHVNIIMMYVDMMRYLVGKVLGGTLLHPSSQVNCQHPTVNMHLIYVDMQHVDMQNNYQLLR